jgi:hypothetical protein
VNANATRTGIETGIGIEIGNAIGNEIGINRVESGLTVAVSGTA